METQLCKVITQSQIASVAEIADIVWHETYDVLLPAGQTKYMIEQFQSVTAITEQIEEKGYIYYLILCDGDAAGYLGVVPNQKAAGELMLSKIYLKKEFRGQGAVGAAFQFVKSLAQEQGMSRIWLTVNKENTHAQEVYKHFGYRRSKEIVSDIGNGYVMDDYIYELLLDGI